MSEFPSVIRPARIEEFAALTQLCREAKAHWGYPERWMEHWEAELQVTPEYLCANPVGVLEHEAGIAGFYGLRYDGVERALEHLWVRPRWIGRGFGRRLFEAATTRARADGANELRIKADPNAEAFYLKLGAARIALERYTLPDGTERNVPILKFIL